MSDETKATEAKSMGEIFSAGLAVANGPRIKATPKQGARTRDDEEKWAQRCAALSMAQSIVSSAMNQAQGRGIPTAHVVWALDMAASMLRSELPSSPPEAEEP